MMITPLLASLALPYALVLVTPGPNLLVVLRAAVNPSWHRSLSVAAGIATGAAIAGIVAAVGASTLSNLAELDTWGSIFLASILLYSAFRLALRSPILQKSQPAASETLSLPLFGLGLATALSNPLSIPFFVSFYLAQPDLRSLSGGAVVCCIIFVMALFWFTAVGWAFSFSAIRRSGAAGREGARYILVLMMTLYALKLLFASLL